MIIFLRHAETEKDPSLNASLWGLSDVGKKQAEEIAELPLMNKVDIIYTSEEKKAILTAEPLAKKLSKKIVPLSFFNEVKRGDKFLTKEEFEKEKAKQLEDLSYPAFNGESGLEALKRFQKGVEEIKENKNILVVTHGTILNIYLANLLNSFSELPERWSKTLFCSYGVVENNIVVKDIITLTK